MATKAAGVTRRAEERSLAVVGDDCRHAYRRDGAARAGVPAVSTWLGTARGTWAPRLPAPTPPPYAHRRRIETDAEGRYRFRSIMPSRYGCPPDGPTRRLAPHEAALDLAPHVVRRERASASTRA